jgi:glutamyl-tRNA synthetase
MWLMSSAKPLVRVRFAPSPTGLLHIGGMRSALFNWLWARHNEGTFILRIEDTDRTRYVEGSTEQIYGSHDALGIAPDEGPVQGGPFAPYVQSERKELGIYSDHAEQLLKTGILYRCWCSPERLATLREESKAKGVAFKYDRHCLISGNQKSISEPHVLRFRIPEEPKIIGWDDAVRGHLEFRLEDLDDFVAIKADGFPTYQFANVVDDHLMEISHVLRADEWLPSTPKHLLLYSAFDWDPPVLGHLPAVQGPTGGKKLSKREGARSVQEYIDEGYLPEALRSYLATLGWNDGTEQEIYSTTELIKGFTLSRIQKSPARFDLERLNWVNGKIIRELWKTDPDELLKQCGLFWPEAADKRDPKYKLGVLNLVQDRLTKLSDLPELSEFFFTDPSVDPAMLTKQLDLSTAKHALGALLKSLEALETGEWSEETLEHTIRPLTEQLGLKTGHFFGLIRVAITGRTAAPGLFETMAALGRETSLRRLGRAEQSLGK